MASWTALPACLSALICSLLFLRCRFCTSISARPVNLALHWSEWTPNGAHKRRYFFHHDWLLIVFVPIHKHVSRRDVSVLVLCYGTDWLPGYQCAEQHPAADGEPQHVRTLKLNWSVTKLRLMISARIPLPTLLRWSCSRIIVISLMSKLKKSLGRSDCNSASLYLNSHAHCSMLCEPYFCPFLKSPSVNIIFRHLMPR